MSTPFPPGFIASPDEPHPAPARLKPAPPGPAVVVHHHGVPAWLVVVLLVAAAILALVAWEQREARKRALVRHRRQVTA